MRHGTRGVLVVLAMIILSGLAAASPVIAHENQTSAYHDGVCYWWGQQSWVGYYGSDGTAKGVTSLWDGPCTKVQVRLRYRDSNDRCITATEKSSKKAYAVVRDGRHTDYSDANVLLGSTWYGFRVDHPGGC